MGEMKILGEAVQVSTDYLGIYDLKFLKDNPRVYACTHSDADFDSLPEGEQQEKILRKLKEEPSVKNLIPEIKRHQGLIEPVLIRRDTMEVIEGNSRLAAYRILQDKQSKGEDIDGEWDMIPCQIVASLTEDQQAAFLNQIHVKGKTKWSAYEKANFAYVRYAAGWKISDIAKLFGESQATVNKRVKVIKMMKENNDSERSHFSYYDVFVRTKPIADAMKEDVQFKSFMMNRVKYWGGDEGENEFTAQEMRKQLPVVLNKKKVLKQYLEDELSLDDAYQRAKVSREKEKIRRANELLDDISATEIGRLSRNDFNAFTQAVRQLKRQVERISGIVKQKSEGEND